mgnify:CR=1 FL=1
MSTNPTLDEALEGVEGWFSPEQVERVTKRAAEVPPGGRIVEIGSFRGRSMVAIGLTAPEGVEIYAIDPHAGNDRGPQEIEGFEDEAAVDPLTQPAVRAALDLARSDEMRTIEDQIRICEVESWRRSSTACRLRTVSAARIATGPGGAAVRPAIITVTAPPARGGTTAPGPMAPTGPRVPPARMVRTAE